MQSMQVSPTVRALLFIIVLAGLLAAGALAWHDVRAQESPDAIDAPLGTAITYQGILQNGAQPASGSYDFRMILYNAEVGGAQIGATVTRDNVAVTAGRFNVQLDFGNIFGNTALWLEIAVRPGASTGAYATLTPRQPLTPAPQARYARVASSASTATTANQANTATTAITATHAMTATTAITALTALTVEMPWQVTYDTSGSMVVLNNPGSGQALEVRSNSTFATMYASNSGTGGTIRADTSSSGQGSAFTGYNYGVDRYAAELEIVNSANPRAALYARTAGNGQAIDAEVNSNTNGDALFARTTSSSASSYAGIFVGNVSISGNLAKSSGSFKIDHPLDPANKYLQHSFVESPDMMNVYNGNVTLDASGAATVILPDYFEALNRDFRYQLTPIGAPGPNLYIAAEITANQFQIAGGAPNGKVSWQVTGIRQDAWATAHPIEVEVVKPPEEQGYYIHPELYGAPAAAGVDQQEHPLYPSIQPPPPAPVGELP